MGITDFVVTAMQFTEDSTALNKLLIHFKEMTKVLEVALGEDTKSAQPEQKNSQQDPTEILLKDSGLPDDVIGVLRGISVGTLADLKAKTEPELIKIFGITKRTMVEKIRDYLQSKGFDFKPIEAAHTGHANGVLHHNNLHTSTLSQ